MSVDQALSLAMKYAKLAASIALLAFILLTCAKLFGFTFYAVPSLGWQEFGVFAAGTAFALKNL